MSVRDMVYWLLVNYPTLFKTKTDCFTHMFLVNGCGLDWHKGQLVTPHHPLDLEPKYESEDLPEGQRWRLLDVKRNNVQVKFVVENFDLLFEEPVIFYSVPACISRHVNLFCVPDDVEEDWKLAVKQTSRALLRWIENEERCHAQNDFQYLRRLTEDLRRRLS